MAEAGERVATRWHLLWRTLLALAVTLLFSVYIVGQAEQRNRYSPEEIMAAGKLGGGWRAECEFLRADLEGRAKDLTEQLKTAPVAVRLRGLEELSILEKQLLALRRETEQARQDEVDVLDGWRRRTASPVYVYFPVVVCLVLCLMFFLQTNRPAHLVRYPLRIRLAGALIAALQWGFALGFFVAGIVMQYRSPWPEFIDLEVWLGGVMVMLLAVHGVTGFRLAYCGRCRWLFVGLSVLAAVVGYLPLLMVLSPPELLIMSGLFFAAALAAGWPLRRHEYIA